MSHAADTTAGIQPAAERRGGEEGGRLQHLKTGARITGDQARAHSAMIRRLRVAVPIVAVFLIGAFLLNTGGDGPEDVFLDELTDAAVTAQNLSTIRPQFSGIDAKGNPFEITADTATQAAGGDRVVNLANPKAVTTTDEARSVVYSRSGVYDDASKILTLDNDVTFEHTLAGGTYVLKTPSATVSVDQKTVQSDKGVTADGPDGAALVADRMAVDDRTGTVRFEGNVKMRLNPASPINTSTGDSSPGDTKKEDE
jgi:lipopolysaccharide export system protein LptC